MKKLIFAFVIGLSLLFWRPSAEACERVGWSQLGTSSQTGWPSGGVGTWTLNLGTNYIPMAGGQDSTDLFTAFALGADGYIHYTHGLDVSASWSKNCNGLGCNTNEGSPMLFSSGQEAVCSGGSFSQPSFIANPSGYVEIGNLCPAGGSTEILNSSGTTNFTLDASGDVYAIGQSGTSCTATGYPHGPCISKTTDGGSTWTTLTAGAVQIVSDLMASSPLLLVLGNSNRVWGREFAGGVWSEFTNEICSGGGTLNAVQIASNTGRIFAINDNGGAAGDLYLYDISGSTCWLPYAETTQMLSITSNQTTTWSGQIPFLGTDSSGNLWAYCVP